MVSVTDYRALLSSFSWYQPELLGKPIVLTYSFSSSPAYYSADADKDYTSQFSALTEWEKGVLREAFGAWQAVSGVTFIEVKKGLGDINVSFIELSAAGADPRAGGVAFMPASLSFKNGDGVSRPTGGDYRLSGDIFFDLDIRTRPLFASEFINGALHEIGHSLGLKHSHEAVGSHQEILDPNPAGSTVMSYAYYPSVLGPIDIAAAQAVYGPAGGGRDSWSWDQSNERLTVLGTAGADLLRGTAADDIVYGKGGADIIAVSMGNDVVYLEGGSAVVKAGDGIDVIYSGLAISNAQSITTSGSWTYARSNAALQEYEAAEYIHFTNFVFDVARSTLVPMSDFEKVKKAYDTIVARPAAAGSLEKASADIFNKSASLTSYTIGLIAGEAQDTTFPAVVAFQSMLGTVPDAAHLKGLADFVHGQIFSSGYQATNDPRLGGYEALGLALSKVPEFTAKNAGATDEAFVSASYSSVFGRSATALQASHFLDQLHYFEGLYEGAGFDTASADMQARGAVYGQMLGYGAREPGNALKLAGEQTLIGLANDTIAMNWLI